MSPASFSSVTNSIDHLIAGPADLILSRGITLLSGQNLARGALLGRQATAGTVVGAAVAGNTGNGTIGTLSAGGGAREGVYRVTIVEPAANLGSFVVEDPDGEVVGHGVVATEFSGPVVFTIADGATDFVAGDQFIVTVTAVTYKYLSAILAATDGSKEPDAILAESTDASAGDVNTVAYFRGDFAENALVLGTGTTVAQYREVLRQKGINIIATVGA